MGLDFTALETIATQRAREPLVEGNLARQPETTGGVALYRLERERQEREHTRQMYNTYQQNIKKAGTLRGSILKGIKQGEDPLALLLKAVECISLMTGDTLLYTQSKEDLVAIYGWGLGYPTPLKGELEDAQHRLAMLTRPELITPQTPPDTRERIKKAITAHRDQIEALKKAIEGNDIRE